MIPERNTHYTDDEYCIIVYSCAKWWGCTACCHVPSPRTTCDSSGPDDQPCQGRPASRPPGAVSSFHPFAPYGQTNFRFLARPFWAIKSGKGQQKATKTQTTTNIIQKPALPCLRNKHGTTNSGKKQYGAFSTSSSKTSVSAATRSGVLLQKLMVVQMLRRFSAYVTRKFITVFTTACHRSLS
jgi:hypothetical protein